jgi:hypothetical protein
MAPFISEASFDVPDLFLAIVSSAVFTLTFFTPTTLPVFSARILVKLGLVL